MARLAASTRRIYAALAALSAALGAACGSPDTVVLVGVRGATSRPLRQLQVLAMVGGESRTLLVPDPPGDPFFLPTNFSLQLPRALGGQLRVTVTAFEDGGRAIGSGSSSLELRVGARNELAVMLDPVPPPDADGGRDAALDASPADAAPADAPSGASSDLLDPADTSTPVPDAVPDTAAEGPGDGGADGPRDTLGDLPGDGLPDARLDGGAGS
jgi:hypothetical protein